jgi:hypothetical protein
MIKAGQKNLPRLTSNIRSVRKKQPIRINIKDEGFLKLFRAPSTKPITINHIGHENSQLGKSNIKPSVFDNMEKPMIIIISPTHTLPEFDLC